jgi:hypothetical protein
MISITFLRIGWSHNKKQEGIEFGALPKLMPMTNQNCLTSACRYCRFYRPEGLHGGACQQLNVSVNSDWKACQLALPAFATTWDNVEEFAHRQAEVAQIISNEKFVVTMVELSDVALSVNN